MRGRSSSGPQPRAGSSRWPTRPRTRCWPGAILPAPQLGDAPRLLTRLEQQGQFVFVHPAAVAAGVPRWRTSGVAYALQMLEAYVYWLGAGGQRWPRLPVVFGLLAGGAAFHLERFIRRGLDPHALHERTVWLETSSYGERALELSLQTFGAGAHVFGSDAPIDTVDSALTPVRAFGPGVADTLLSNSPLEPTPGPEARWAA